MDGCAYADARTSVLMRSLHAAGQEWEDWDEGVDDGDQSGLSRRQLAAEKEATGANAKKMSDPEVLGPGFVRATSHADMEPIYR